MILSPSRRRIVDLVSERPGLTELEIAREIFGPGTVQQRVNADVRYLVAQRLVVRVGSAPFRYEAGGDLIIDDASSSTLARHVDADLSEDQIKVVLRDWMEAQGYAVLVAMGKERGIDIEATRGEERWIVEVKGPGSLQPMRVNYFLAILGETLQRMDDPAARYSIAVPDMPQYRRLWARLPSLAKERTGISALFVDRSGNVLEG